MSRSFKYKNNDGMGAKKKNAKPKGVVYICSECMADFVRPQGVKWLNSYSFECPHCGGAVYEEDFK